MHYSNTWDTHHCLQKEKSLCPQVVRHIFLRQLIEGLLFQDIHSSFSSYNSLSLHQKHFGGSCLWSTAG